MANNLNYLSHDNNILRSFILIIALGSLIAFSCALFSFIKRKQDHKIAKITRKISYFLSVITFLAAIVFLIWHNSFFVSKDLKNMLENTNTTPKVVIPSESIVVSLPNTSGVESINRNYEILNYKINKCEAKCQNDSIFSFQMLNVRPEGKSEEMKKNDINLKIYPEFSMNIPSDPILNGAVVDMEISLTVKIPYFPEGSSGYLLKEEDITENVTFRIATPSEVSFYDNAGKYIGLIWYTLGGCLIFFILTMSFAGNSYYKPVKVVKAETNMIPEKDLNNVESNLINSQS